MLILSFYLFYQDIFKGVEAKEKEAEDDDEEEEDVEDYDIEEVLRAHQKKGGKIIGM